MKGSVAATLWSPHIRFGALPKPDHETGQISYSIPSPRPIQLRTPAYGIISQRRVRERDERGDQFVLKIFRAWQEDNPGDVPPIWNEVNWTEPPHPGNRVVFRFDGDRVSPTTNPVGVAEFRASKSGLRRVDQIVNHSELVSPPSRSSTSSSTTSQHNAEVCCRVQ